MPAAEPNALARALPILPAAASTLGVVGGGQLGRMFAHAAQQMGYGVVVLDPEAHGPAGQVAQRQVVAAYDDAAAIAQLAQAAAAFTTEFENVPAGTLRTLAAHGPVSPPADALAVCQHRAREKAHFVANGVPTAPHALLADGADLARVRGLPLFPGILKTATLGYDGKGQVSVARPDALEAAWRSLGEHACVLEQRLDLALEFSVVVARGHDGNCVHLPPQQNLHRDGILAVTQVPAPDVPAATAAAAIAHAERLAAGMAYVGVLCVEFFLLRSGELVANEMAPRPHNSGHHSIDSCDVSQFELQVRTMAGLPLVEPRLQSPAVMLNLLGDLWFAGGSPQAVDPPWDLVLALPGAHLHLYGKQQARHGRKMGHLTITAPSLALARERAHEAAALLGLPPF